ncbi:MAG: hypothetical protein QOJ89_3602 [bacterium]
MRIIAGSRGDQFYALATNHDGLTAIVTGSPGTRTVLIRKPSSSTFTTKLRRSVGNRARGAHVGRMEEPARQRG